MMGINEVLVITIKIHRVILMSNRNPVGLFDSGVGGLTVMKEMRKILPFEDLIYVADSAHCPYGFKEPSQIRTRALAICDFLLSKNVKMIVIASNTTSTAALDLVRNRYHIPIVGMEPAVKPAVAITRNGKIGILATEVTISGERLSSLVRRFANGVEVFTQPCPGLVEAVEEGRVEEPATRELLSRYLTPLLANGVDTVVLGCTHYPHLKHLVESIVGPEVKVIETGRAVARRAAQLLEQMNILNDHSEPGQEFFYTTGDPEQVEPVVRRLWGDFKAKVQLINI